MGLFGYNEKDYNKNTAAFKDKIFEIHARARYISGASNSGVGMVLSKVAKLADFYKYPKNADGKQMKAIDERINHIIDLMQSDIQDENIPRLSAHADVLFEAFKDARQYGKERYSEEYLRHGEIKAEAMGEMLRALEKKAQLQKEAEEFDAEYTKAEEAGDEAECERLDLEYQARVSEMEDCDASLQDWKLNYDQASQIQSELNKEREVEQITSADLMSPEQFAIRVAKINQKLEKHIDRAAEIGSTFTEARREREIARGGVGTNKRSLKEKHAQEKMIRAQKDIENANAPASEQKFETEYKTN